MRAVLSAVCLCVPRNAGHVTEQPRRGIFFAKNAVAGANYSCVRARHTTPHHCLANGRHGEAIGTIRRGKSAIHFIAGPELAEVPERINDVRFGANPDGICSLRAFPLLTDPVEKVGVFDRATVDATYST